MAGGRYILPGLIGGVVAGPGALLAVSQYLASVNVSHSALMAVFGILGALPGLAVGFLLKWAQDRRNPSPPLPPSSKESHETPQDGGRE